MEDGLLVEDVDGPHVDGAGGVVGVPDVGELEVVVGVADEVGGGELEGDAVAEVGAGGSVVGEVVGVEELEGWG